MRNVPVAGGGGGGGGGGGDRTTQLFGRAVFLPQSHTHTQRSHTVCAHALTIGTSMLSVGRIVASLLLRGSNSNAAVNTMANPGGKGQETPYNPRVGTGLNKARFPHPKQCVFVLVGDS